MLCPSSTSQQYPGAFSNTVFDRHRCIDQMVAWQTCPEGICLTSTTMVSFSKFSITIKEISPSMASPDVGPPGTLPYSFLQDSVHQACCRPWHTLQSQTGHRGLVDVQSSNMLLQILVRVQNKHAALNPSDPHWVLSRSLLHSLLPPELAVIAEGSLSNKVFPSKQEYHNQMRLAVKT